MPTTTTHTYPYRLLILDFDGTVGDSQQLILHTMQQTIKTLGLEYRTPQQCAQMIGLPLKQCFTDLIPMSEEMGDYCANTYRKLFEQNNVEGAVRLFPHVRETLRCIKEQGTIITVASSRNRHSLSEYMENLLLTPYIEYYLGADDVQRAKPHPEPVLRTLHHFNISPKDTLVVGDAKFDILMGKNAGTHTCGVTYGNGTENELRQAGADFLINRFDDLLHSWRPQTTGSYNSHAEY